MQTSLDKKSLSIFVWSAVFVLVAIIGFAYVKWIPYYAKAFIAQNQHSIGDQLFLENQVLHRLHHGVQQSNMPLLMVSRFGRR